jgi:hypothetical protein
LIGHSIGANRKKGVGVRPDRKHSGRRVVFEETDECGGINPRKVSAAVNDQGSPPLGQHLSLNHFRSMAVSHVQPFHQVVAAMHSVPVDGRITQQHAELVIDRE